MTQHDKDVELERALGITFTSHTEESDTLAAVGYVLDAAAKSGRPLWEILRNVEKISWEKWGIRHGEGKHLMVLLAENKRSNGRAP